MIISLLFIACHKNDTDRHIGPPIVDSTAFSIPITEDIVMYEVNLRALSATADVLAFTKISGQDTVFVINNLRNITVFYDVPAEFENTMWVVVFDGRELILNGVVELEAYEYFIVKK